MKIDGTPYRSLWWDTAAGHLKIIDQRHLPYRFEIAALEDLPSYAAAILEMRVRGAPLIGATAAYGMAFAMGADPSTRRRCPDPRP